MNMFASVKGEPKVGKTAYMYTVMASLLLDGQDIVVVVDQAFGEGVYDHVHLNFVRRLIYSLWVKEGRKFSWGDINLRVRSSDDLIRYRTFGGQVFCCGRPEDLHLYASPGRAMFLLESTSRTSNLELYMKALVEQAMRTGVSAYFDVSGVGGIEQSVQNVWGLESLYVAESRTGDAGVVRISNHNFTDYPVQVHPKKG